MQNASGSSPNPGGSSLHPGRRAVLPAIRAGAGDVALPRCAAAEARRSAHRRFRRAASDWTARREPASPATALSRPVFGILMRSIVLLPSPVFARRFLHHGHQAGNGTRGCRRCRAGKASGREGIAGTTLHLAHGPNGQPVPRRRRRHARGCAGRSHRLVLAAGLPVLHVAPAQPAQSRSRGERDRHLGRSRCRRLRAGQRERQRDGAHGEHRRHRAGEPRRPARVLALAAEAGLWSPAPDEPAGRTGLAHPRVAPIAIECRPSRAHLSTWTRNRRPRSGDGSGSGTGEVGDRVRRTGTRRVTRPDPRRSDAIEHPNRPDGRRVPRPRRHHGRVWQHELAVERATHHRRACCSGPATTAPPVGRPPSLRRRRRRR